MAGAAPASAHVNVLPATVTRDEAVEFTVRVPNERDIATTRLRLDVPEQVTVYSLGETPRGWSAALTRGSDGRVRAIVFSGGRIAPGRYADFTVLGTPFGDGEALWPARQTYSDGMVKPWTDPAQEGDAAESGPTDPGPAARVTIVADAGAGAPATPVASSDGDSGAAVWLGVIAIAISGLAVLAVGFLWSTRPARLPDDDGPG